MYYHYITYSFNNTLTINRQIFDNHPEIKAMILEYVAPNWNVMLGYRNRIFIALVSLLGTTFVTVIRPLWFIRFIFGISITSLGILWHATLSSYEYLYIGARYVVELLDSFGFKLPIPSYEDIKEFNHASLYTIAGILLLGTLGIALSIILLEWYCPPMNLPIEPTYWDRFFRWAQLEHINNWWVAFDHTLYIEFPRVYDFFYSINNYVVSPFYHYFVQIPFNYSYDYLFHPTADGIRYVFDFFTGGKRICCDVDIYELLRLIYRELLILIYQEQYKYFPEATLWGNRMLEDRLINQCQRPYLLISSKHTY